MADVHVNDTALTLRCVTTADLSDVSTAEIRYFDPDGVLGSFPGTIPSPATDGYITYDIQSPNDLYKAGEWRFWAYVKMNNGDETIGDTYILNIKAPGQP